MSFNIERGLFKYDFTDHHAILGIPVNADVKEVRKRYLMIARNLHPDSCKAKSETEKKLASQLLSKLVNPAYEQLSQSNRDYHVSLEHVGRRLAAEAGKVSPVSEAAKQLANSGPNLDNVYKKSLQGLTAKQYDPFDQALDKIGEISELNMVYLMLKGGKFSATASTPVGTATAGTKTTTGTATPGAKTTTGTATPGAKTTTGTATPGKSGETVSNLPDSGTLRVNEYIRRAEGYMGKDKNNFAAATLELREALKLDPRNSRCYTLLGIAYLKQKQATMAKVNFKKALELNPNDEMAKKGIKHIEELTQKSSGAKPNPQPQQPQSKPSDKQGGGGFLGGLFGGKKK
jgi:curved DNA-binding protein CbpA